MSTIPYYSTPGMPEQMTGGPDPVQMAVAAPARQQRITVLFRSLMIIPHSFVLYFLGIAAGIIAFIGWWAALFTGRLPEFAQNYLTGYVRWSSRVHAYLMFLTDVFPPFSLDDEPGYPVRIGVPPAANLNRLAVFFRSILAFPAALLGSLVVLGGMTIVAFIAWLITLIAGELPASLHLAYAAIVRYVTRVNCYYYLLTPTYPGGLFGDGPAAPAYGVVPPASDLPPAGYPGAPGSSDPGYTPTYTGPDYVGPAYGAPAGYGAPGYGQPPYAAPGGYGTPGGYGAPGGYGTPPGYGAPAGYGMPASPPDWRLILTSGARSLVGAFVGIGVVFWVGYFALIAIAIAAGPTVPATPAGSSLPALTASPTAPTAPAGEARIGGAAQGVSVDVPSSWVKINLAQDSIEKAAKEIGLHGVSASTIVKDMQSLQSVHAVFAADVAYSGSSKYAPNLNAYCVTSGVTDVGSAGVPFIREAAASEFGKIATHVIQKNAEIGGVPGVDTTYQLSTTGAGTIYGSQLEVLPKPDKVCFVTVASTDPQLSNSVASTAAATAQFP